MRTTVLLMLAVLSSTARAQGVGVKPDAKTIFSEAKSASAIILTGEGSGRSRSLGTGVLVSKDGVLLTALHVVKNAAEVQVRLASGEVFDDVRLLGTDERRDIAAIKINAGDLPFLSTTSASTLAAGDPVYAVTNAEGMTWSATEGIFSALRPADEVSGAGSGYRLLQFTAPVAPGSSGGALLNQSGAIVGIITRALGNTAFAVPVESVIGLISVAPQARFGSGTLLQMRSAPDAPQSSAAIANLNPTQLLRDAKTIFLQSKTSFLTVDTLDRALRKQKEWNQLGLTLVQDPRVADVMIEIDRPIFTYVHTFRVIDKRSSIVLGSGKVTAFDGTLASSGLATDITKLFAAARVPQTKK